MAQRDSTSAAPLALDLRSTLHDDIGDEGFDIDLELDGRATTARYVVERELGRGGLSVVYAASQVDAQRQVAIKVPFPHLPDKLALRSRFVREARITAAVSHPNIVRIHDSGVLPDGRPYLVTELVPGESLEQRLERGPLSAEDALFVAEQLLDAVAALGQQGIVHRDIKPSNIMVGSDDVRLISLKLLDLGIAQRVQETGHEPPMAQGPAAGTPMYMAPEQLNGLAVDVRTDVYACGAVLYECMFGLQDDGQRDVRGALRQMRTDSIRPWVNTGRNRYPRALVRVVGTALHPQRKKRFPSADAMRKALAVVRRRSERALAQRVLIGSASLAAASLALASVVYFAPSFGSWSARDQRDLSAALRPAVSEPIAARPSVLAPAPAAPTSLAPNAAAPTTTTPATSAPASPGQPSSDTVAPAAATDTPSALVSAPAEETSDPVALAAQATARRVARAQSALSARDFRAARRHAQSALAVDARDPGALRIAFAASIGLHDPKSARDTLAHYVLWYPNATDLTALRAQLAAAR